MQLEVATPAAAEWFFRHGAPVDKPVRALTATTGEVMLRPGCGRCGGAGGSDKWAHTGWTCFDCGGSGLRSARAVKVYSADKLAKLNATAAKARQRKADKAAEAEAAKLARGRIERRAFFRDFGPLLLDAYKRRHDNSFLADMVKRAWAYGTLSQGQLDAMPAAIARVEDWSAKRAAEAARKAKATYVGTVGERIEQTLTLEKRITGGDPSSRWGMWSLKILRNEDGCTLTTFGVCDADEGDTFRAKFTVKGHNSRDGEPQTEITRVKVLA